MIKDTVVDLQDAVREPAIAHEMPDACCGVELGTFGQQRHSVVVQLRSRTPRLNGSGT
jgi:hypothetical protein